MGEATQVAAFVAALTKAQLRIVFEMPTPLGLAVRAHLMQERP